MAPMYNAIKTVRLLMVSTLTILLPFCFVFFASGEIVDSRRDARSILTQKCMACQDSCAKISGLSLASRADAEREGKYGAALNPGKPNGSLLIQMNLGASPRMPLQAARLSPGEVATLRSWIAAGAVWHGDAKSAEA
jgi:hypothetical protein